MLKIRHAGTDEDIARTFDVMSQLRPELSRDSYVARIRDLMASDGFRLAYLEEDEVRCVAGYRFLEMLYCGRILSVDDLVSDADARSHGYGARMLHWLKAEARKAECNELQLISRVTREQAHRFYFREGLGIDCYHFRCLL
jgi:GNAT superfamily N-acetyltransferase